MITSENKKELLYLIKNYRQALTFEDALDAIRNFNINYNNYKKLHSNQSYVVTSPTTKKLLENMINKK